MWGVGLRVGPGGVADGLIRVVDDVVGKCGVKGKGCVCILELTGMEM